MSGQISLLSQADDAADKLLRFTNKWLKPAAHVCLLSTFFDDTLRMIFQWGDQANFFQRTWGLPSFLTHFLVFFLCFGQACCIACELWCDAAQLVPSVLILARKFVKEAVYVLAAVIFTQIVAYSVLWSLDFFLKNLAVMGSLALLLAETTEGAKQMFAGLPASDVVNKTGNYLQLVGRVMIVLMFLTTISFDGVLRYLFDIAGLGLVALVAVGFKTKVASFSLVILLLLQNLIYNAFWTIASGAVYHRDLAKYHFFQTMTVVGGLLLIIVLGPGGVSVDQRKKDH